MTDWLELLIWNLIAFSVLAGVVLTLGFVPFLRRRPALMHGLWLVVLLKLVTPPIVPVPVLPELELEREAGVTPQDELPGAEDLMTDVATLDVEPAELELVPALRESGPTEELSVHSQTAEVLPSGELQINRPDNVDAPAAITFESIAYLILAVSATVTLVLWMLAIRTNLKLRRLFSTEMSDDRFNALVRDVAGQFGLKLCPRVGVIDAVVAPMLSAGLRRPMVILPRPVLQSLNDDQLRSIIAHEIAHLARRDHWTHALASVIGSLFWWNPLVWLVRRAMLNAAEASCDALAIQRMTGSRKAYASTLVEVVDSLNASGPGVPQFNVSFRGSRSMKSRVRLIADDQVASKLPRWGWLFLLAASVLLPLLPTHADELVAQPEDSKPSATVSETAGPYEPDDVVAFVNDEGVEVRDVLAPFHTQMTKHSWPLLDDDLRKLQDKLLKQRLSEHIDRVLIAQTVREQLGAEAWLKVEKNIDRLFEKEIERFREKTRNELDIELSSQGLTLDDARYALGLREVTFHWLASEFRDVPESERKSAIDKRLEMLRSEADITICEKPWKKARPSVYGFELSPKELLVHLRLRDNKFQNRTLELERRWSEHIEPAKRIAEMRFNAWRFGGRRPDRANGKELFKAPPPFDQKHRRRCRLTVREPEVTLDTLCELEEIRDWMPANYHSPPFNGFRRSSVTGMEVTFHPNSGGRKDRDVPFQLDGFLRWMQHAMEWGSGYGMSRWIQSIESTARRDDRLVVKGTAHVFDHAESEFEIELDQDLIMRRCFVSTPSASGGSTTVDYLSETEGTVRLKNSPPVAKHSIWKRLHIPSKGAAHVYEQCEYEFVGLSAPLTDDQYKAATGPPVDAEWPQATDTRPKRRSVSVTVDASNIATFKPGSRVDIFAPCPLKHVELSGSIPKLMLNNVVFVEAPSVPADAKTIEVTLQLSPNEAHLLLNRTTEPLVIHPSTRLSAEAMRIAQSQWSRQLTLEDFSFALSLGSVFVAFRSQGHDQAAEQIGQTMQRIAVVFPQVRDQWDQLNMSLKELKQLALPEDVVESYAEMLAPENVQQFANTFQRMNQPNAQRAVLDTLKSTKGTPAGPLDSPPEDADSDDAQARLEERADKAIPAVVKELEFVALNHANVETRLNARRALAEVGYTVWHENRVYPTNTVFFTYPIWR